MISSMLQTIIGCKHKKKKKTKKKTRESAQTLERGAWIMPSFSLGVPMTNAQYL